MMVTIEVANEAGGLGTVKRAVFRSEDFDDTKKMEEALIIFTREASQANEDVLRGGRA